MIQPTLTPQPTLDQDPGYCPHCQTTRPSLCAHDADIEHGRVPASAKRPPRCLNAYNPHTAPFPEGF